MSKQLNIPTLRFPKFKGEWEKKKLGEVAPLQRGFDLPVDNIKIGEFPVVFSNGILKYHNEFKAKAPGVVTGRSGTIGKVTFVEKDYWPHNTSLWVTDFKGNYPKFIYYFYSKYNLERFGTGSGVPTLNRNDVHIQEEFFPTLPEQTKIAEFFTAIDAKIQTLKTKKQLLQQYKKGVMQQLFTPSELGFRGLKDEQDFDTTNPKILKSSKSRFRQENGKEFPKWEMKKLGEVLDYEQPTNYLVSSTEYEDRFETPVVTAGKTFILGYTDETNGIFKDNLPVIIFDDFTTATQFVNFPFKAKSSAMKILKAKENSNIKFIYEAMQMIDYETGGHGRHWISVFAEMEISIPSLPEQTKIANFLSSIDEKINHTATQIEKMEVWKKGLLQKMFV
jgi:type I restriction enzyme S subunit